MFFSIHLITSAGEVYIPEMTPINNEDVIQSQDKEYPVVCETSVRLR